MANSVDPDEMAYYKPSHLDLHCLQRYMVCSAGIKELTLVGLEFYSPINIIKVILSQSLYLTKLFLDMFSSLGG